MIPFRSKLITGSSYQVSAESVATLKLDELAKILRRKRMNDGAISFDNKVEIKLLRSEEPEGVYFKVSKMPIILLKNLCF
jgi:ribonuclease R